MKQKSYFPLYVTLKLACEQGEGIGKEGGRGKREPVGMAKDFDFQMPKIYVIFKLTIQVARTFSRKIRNSLDSSDI